MKAKGSRHLQSHSVVFPAFGISNRIFTESKELLYFASIAKHTAITLRSHTKSTWIKHSGVRMHCELTTGADCAGVGPGGGVGARVTRGG